MPTIEQSVEVNVPVSTAYNQWTQFEEFPKFMYWRPVHKPSEMVQREKEIALHMAVG